MSRRTLVPALLLLTSSCWTAHCEDPWRFITIADWHGAEPFARRPILNEKDIAKTSVAVKIDAFKHIKDNYGGELVVLPGDAEAGKWYKSSLLRALNVTTPEQAVRKAGRQCYQSMNIVFEEAGYSKLLMAVGDHEIGGNPWNSGQLKTDLVPNFRQIFYEGFNTNARGRFLYRDRIGNAPSRPFGTIFAKTSYAYRHKNVLFVTVDVFNKLADNFIDKMQGLGGSGAVTCEVTGAHLAWFEKVLSEARKDPSIKHIIVQAHPPILQPVRKVRCTGQFVDGAESSAFFQAMREYDVDLYLAGEVHANTATKDIESNVLQVVSRGNAVENFLTVDITDDAINITQYNKIETENRRENAYEFYGQLILDKSGEEATFESIGSLKLLDRQQPMMYFSFDELSTLSERPVLALIHDDIKTTLVQRKITIKGIECWDSFPNMGAYDQPYDAQVGNVVLRDGVKGQAAELNSTSRIAVFGYGPHSGGVKVSYSLWFKTQRAKKKQILLHFGEVYSTAARSRNPVFTLTLDKGIPALYAGDDRLMVPSEMQDTLANNEWQHVAISMPRNSCRLSEVEMYVNGQRLATEVKGKDGHLFFTTSGSVSIGGDGHSHRNFYKKILPEHEPYVGLIDEVYVWADSLSAEQVVELSQLAAVPAPAPEDITTAPTASPTVENSELPENPSLEPTAPPTVSFTFYWNHRCTVTSPPRWYNLIPHRCRKKCMQRSACLGYVSVFRNGVYKCGHFQVTPKRGVRLQGAVCAVKDGFSGPLQEPSVPPPSFTVYTHHKCNSTSHPKWYNLNPRLCEEKCTQRRTCGGYFSVMRNGSYKCGHFNVAPTRGDSLENAVCAIKD